MRISRRDVLKGGAATTSAAVLALGSGTRSSALDRVNLVKSTNPGRRTGKGPLYWTTYGYENQFNTIIPEDEWSANVEWVESTFKSYGYTMLCTDGWIDSTQEVTRNGYIVKHDDSWTHGWAWWADHLEQKGLQLGVYYNPLWVTRSALDDPSVTVVGRPDIRVADIVDPNDPFDGTHQLYWVDATRDGAEEYVKGYVNYFRQLGAAMLRIDFLGWYEIGYDQSEGTVCMNHGREAYTAALRWIYEASGDMTLSLVLPNLFNHAEVERIYGDMIRIDNDVGQGGWFLSAKGARPGSPSGRNGTAPFWVSPGFRTSQGEGRSCSTATPRSSVRSRPTINVDPPSACSSWPAHRSPSPIATTPSARTPRSSRTPRYWPCATPG